MPSPWASTREPELRHPQLQLPHPHRRKAREQVHWEQSHNDWYQVGRSNRYQRPFLANIKVVGATENRPQLLYGDSVRMRFADADLATAGVEWEAMVISVDQKTSVVQLLLPTCLGQPEGEQAGTGTLNAAGTRLLPPTRSCSTRYII